MIHYVERLIDFFRQTGGIAAGSEKLFAEIVWPHSSAVEILLFVLILVYCTAHESVRVLGKEKCCDYFSGQPRCRRSK